MRAIIQHAYGPPAEVLRLRDIDTPTITDDDVLIEVRAAAVAGEDWRLMHGRPYAARLATGLRSPRRRVPGRDVAGRVVAVGSRVRGLDPGDEVYGWCDGAFAELAAVRAARLTRKPRRLTLEQAAVVPTSGTAALQAVRDAGRVRPGDRVLVTGASGGVGSFAVQIAKAYGAEVTGVCSTTNTDMVASLGADHVIDYTREDAADCGQCFDVVIDLVGCSRLSDLRGAVRRNGTVVVAGGLGGRPAHGARRPMAALLLTPFVPQRLRPLILRRRRRDLEVLGALIDAGKVTPVVSAHYPLAAVPEAIRHFAPGHARGKVAITV